MLSRIGSQSPLFEIGLKFFEPNQGAIEIDHGIVSYTRWQIESDTTLPRSENRSRQSVPSPGPQDDLDSPQTTIDYRLTITVTSKFWRTYAIHEEPPHENSMTQRALSERELAIEDLAPSAKLVYKTLEYEGALTQKKLIERTRLPTRTVRDAIRMLENHSYLEERLCKNDARQQLYVLRSGTRNYDD